MLSRGSCNKITYMISNYKYIISTIVFLAGFNIIHAQGLTVPIDVQLEILPKILSLNKSFNHNDPKEVINVGILYSNEQRSSVRVKDEITNSVSDSVLKVNLAKAVIIPIDIVGMKNIKKHLIDLNIKVLYFTPIRGYDISKISKISKENQIITFTGVSDYIDNNNISVGFELENKKLQITINLESAKAEGANFSSRLLKVSKVKE
jgi:YfiR/HmsC-like